jgi:hypothetical protein
VRMYLPTDREDSLLERHLHRRLPPLPWRYSWWAVASWNVLLINLRIEEY